MKKMILCGAGHAHLGLLRSLARQPLSDVDILLISDSPRQYYSGMVSGFFEGHYTEEEISYDVQEVARQAAVPFLLAKIQEIDGNRNTVRLADGTEYKYDYLSLNLGSTGKKLPGFAGRTAKPFSHLRDLKESLGRKDRSPRLLVVGSGATAVEMALAAASLASEKQPVSVDISLAKDSPLPKFSPAVQMKARYALEKAGVGILENSMITGVRREKAGYIANTVAGEEQEYSEVLLAAGVSPVAVDMKGFTTDARGYVQVEDTLQATGHPHVLGVGDCIAWRGRSLPKIGVYPVRQTPVLIHNWRALLTGKPLRAYAPQRHALQILNLSGKKALLQYGNFHWQGRLPWLIKDRIDRRFMKE